MDKIIIEITPIQVTVRQNKIIHLTTIDGLKEVLEQFKKAGAYIVFKGEYVTYKVIELYASSRFNINKLLMDNKVQYLGSDKYHVTYKVINHNLKTGMYKISVALIPLKVIDDIKLVIKEVPNIKLLDIIVGSQRLVHKKLKNMQVVVDNDEMYALNHGRVLFNKSFIKYKPIELEHFVKLAEYNVQSSNLKLAVINTNLDSVIENTRINTQFTKIDNIKYKFKKPASVYVILEIILFLAIVIYPYINISMKTYQLENINTAQFSTAMQLQEDMTNLEYQHEQYAQITEMLLKSETDIEEIITLLSYSYELEISSIEINYDNQFVIQATYTSYEDITKYINKLEKFNNNIEFEINKEKVIIRSYAERGEDY
ncbi:MAG: hypothetical protein BEN19_02710 [Epulopiscium sp. Nuni2H_MBin003]|nr:MAG: hypothetical protein BEN19_02710 [Epulopiscium sp. Nuni2H_MBin003]